MSDIETRTHHIPKVRIVETLAWLAAGKSAKQVAVEMGLSLRSVYVCSTWGVQLLGARTVAHACALLAMSDNLVLDLGEVDRARVILRRIEASHVARRRKARE